MLEEVNMDIRISVKLALLLAACINLAACQQLVLRPQPEPVAEQPPKEVEPQPLPPPDTMPASQRVRKALQQLELGDYENARNQLNWALLEKPELQIADNLLTQIDADPIDYLGVKNFYYQVENGDSLSIIAEKFLDDPMKFVILARYNHLDNPSKLAPGDRIRVPGEMPAEGWKRPKPKKKPRVMATTTATQESKGGAVSTQQALSSTKRETSAAAVTQDTPSESQTSQPSDNAAATARRSEPPSLELLLDTAKQLHAQGDLPAAIYLLDSEGGRYANTKAMQTLRITYYQEYAELLVKQGDLDTARQTLEKLVLLNADDEQAINSLIQVEDKLEARKLYQRGKDLFAGGYVEDAYHVFSQALTYDPDNPQISQDQIASRDKLTEDYHRQAMQHFRKQELDEAIVLWDKILTMNPEHPLASGYKARAVEMKQKLQKIGAGE
jgi:tetratricopeptide (TPR) repeat protein